MKILHYTLGFAPERSGGLVRYATDLMMAQRTQKHEVLALYPGRLNYLNKSMAIKKGKDLAFPTFQIINSLPLAVSGGIKQPSLFMTAGDPVVYKTFLQEENPDLIHLHTLMGLHKEFLEVARELGIKIVMTSHDYFGLAPNPSFYANGQSWDQHLGPEVWQRMSQEAYSVRALRLLQSPIYPVIRWLRRKVKPFKQPLARKAEAAPALVEQIDYTQLIAYYQSMFSSVDAFHFNSQLAREVFERHLWQTPSRSKVLSISHGQISSQTEAVPWRWPIRLAYVGPDASYKGFDFFLDIMKDWQDRPPIFDWHSWGYPPRKDLPTSLHQHGTFALEDMDQVYQDFDVLIVPSQWKETFGFIVLEALAQGKMVLTSQNVGSKDLLPPEWFFQDKGDLLTKLENLKEEQPRLKLKTLSEHVQELVGFYQEVIEGEENHVSV